MTRCVCAARCKLLSARSATRAEIESCHSPALVELVESSSAEVDGTRYFTPDTYANQHTATCASIAAAACADVATAVYSGRARSGAAIVRWAVPLYPTLNARTLALLIVLVVQ